MWQRGRKLVVDTMAHASSRSSCSAGELQEPEEIEKVVGTQHDDRELVPAVDAQAVCEQDGASSDSEDNMPLSKWHKMKKQEQRQQQQLPQQPKQQQPQQQQQRSVNSGTASTAITAGAIAAAGAAVASGSGSAPSVPFKQVQEGSRHIGDPQPPSESVLERPRIDLSAAAATGNIAAAAAAADGGGATAALSNSSSAARMSNEPCAVQHGHVHFDAGADYDDSVHANSTTTVAAAAAATSAVGVAATAEQSMYTAPAVAQQQAQRASSSVPYNRSCGSTAADNSSKQRTEARQVHYNSQQQGIKYSAFDDTNEQQPVEDTGTDMYDIDAVASTVPDKASVSTPADSGFDAIQNLNKLSEDFERIVERAQPTAQTAAAATQPPLPPPPLPAAAAAAVAAAVAAATAAARTAAAVAAASPTAVSSGRNSAPAPRSMPAATPVNSSHYATAAPTVNSAAAVTASWHRHDMLHGSSASSTAATAVRIYRAAAAPHRNSSDSSSAVITKDNSTGWKSYTERPLYNKSSGHTYSSSSSSSSGKQSAASTSRLSLRDQQQDRSAAVHGSRSTLQREALLELHLLHQSGASVDVKAKVRYMLH
jgi:hypothetical protein